MHGGFESLIFCFTLAEIPYRVQKNFNEHEDRIQCKSSISEVEIPDCRDAVSHGNDRGDTQSGFRIQNDSEGKDEKPRDVKKDS